MIHAITAQDGFGTHARLCACGWAKACLNVEDADHEADMHLLRLPESEESPEARSARNHGAA